MTELTDEPSLSGVCLAGQLEGVGTALYPDQNNRLYEYGDISIASSTNAEE